MSERIEMLRLKHGFTDDLSELADNPEEESHLYLKERLDERRRQLSRQNGTQ
jgi:hypothetical protein